MTVVLGIDPGIAKTGYGVIACDARRYQHIDHNTIETSPELPTGERLSQIFHGISAVITQFAPDIAGIESLYFAKNISSAMPVAEARGVLRLALHELQVPTREFPPQEIKQAISGTGRADKKQIQELVRVLLGLPEIPSPNHAADALATAICCFNRASADAKIEAAM